MTLSCAGVVYLASLPVGWYSYRRRMKLEGTV
jgi:hypothetical protein